MGGAERVGRQITSEVRWDQSHLIPRSSHQAQKNYFAAPIVVACTVVTCTVVVCSVVACAVFDYTVVICTVVIFTVVNYTLEICTTLAQTNTVHTTVNASVLD